MDILVIDDVVERHSAYRTALQDLAIRIEAVVSGDEARRHLNDHRFGIVLRHLDGPAGDAEADSIARDFETRPDLPVIFIAGSMEDVRRVEQALTGAIWREAGAGPLFDYLPAPIVPELLRRKVRLLLELCHWRDRASELGRETELLRALVSEQAHRGKNLMAIIQSITLRTLSDGRDVAEARVALACRIRTLARAYDLLGASSARGAALADIVEAELSDVGHRVTTAGPPVRVSGTLVQTLALAVHELATNAVKYGALCVPGGTVAVGWTFFEHGSERYLEIGWTERGGPPPVKPAPRHGFGLSLISSMAGSGAEVPNFSFERDGFACRMRLSQDMIAAE